ncbi:MAG: MnmC family methyltransferase [Candidatus Woesearchaeota archaeon]
MPSTKTPTKDGSPTYYSSEYGEHYHSTSGALEEANKKYSDVVGIDAYDSVSVLDVCFGLGYNTAAAVDKFTGSKIVVVGLESYQGIIDEIVNLCEAGEYPFQCEYAMQTVAKTGRYSDENVDVKLVMGDARDTIKELKDETFDVVFHDPFSPQKCPELWTEEFFKEEYRVMKKGGKLATYSCARIVRDNLKAAGFTVSDTKPVGRRAPGTMALKQ